VIVFGTRMYGQVDRMPEGYVATQFFHIWFIPLFPIKSLLVTEDTGGDGVRGISLGWSGKSILAAYFRAAGVVATLVSGGFAAVCLLGGLDEGFQTWDYYSQTWSIDWAAIFGTVVFGGIALVAPLAVWGSYKLLGTASTERRRDLLESIRARANRPY
jgi:hypothetical protein